MRTIAVVTGARAEYGILRPVMKKIAARPDLALRLMVTGAHLSPAVRSIDAIEQDGFAIDDRIDMLEGSDNPEGIAVSMGRGTVGFARAFGARVPDLLLVAGDRYETHAAVVASVPFNIPVAHIHGGEITEGAIDDVLRHAITKMSHLHFAATEPYARRLRQMGEESWRVIVSGAPSLDTARELPRLSAAELEARLGRRIDGPLLVVTFHPVTREFADTACQIEELLAAIDATSAGATVLVTWPNADTNAHVIVDAVRAYAASRANAIAVPDLGSAAYFSVLDRAAAMIGNSSSGIVEAASFRLPVVDIGARQQGRLAAANVIHAGNSRDAIADAIREAMSPAFRERLRNLVNPYGDGHAADRIVSTLADVEPGPRLLMKRFVDA